MNTFSCRKFWVLTTQKCTLGLFTNSVLKVAIKITDNASQCPSYFIQICILFLKTLLFFLQIDLMPHDVITQLLRVLAIETKQEKAIINAEQADAALSGLEAFSFDYIVKWPLSLIINRSVGNLYN